MKCHYALFFMPLLPWSFHALFMHVAFLLMCAAFEASYYPHMKAYMEHWITLANGNKGVLPVMWWGDWVRKELQWGGCVTLQGRVVCGV